MRRLVILSLLGYKQYVSPLLPSACRFHPTCSEYMREAVEVWGLGQGIWLGLKRIARCQPFCKGGFDPVPRPGTDQSESRAGSPALAEFLKEKHGNEDSVSRV